MFPKCNRRLPPKKPRLLKVQPQISRRIGKAASDQMFPKCNRRLPPKKPRLLKVQPQISRRIGKAASDQMFPKCNRRLPPKKPRLLKVQPQISRRIGKAASDQMFPKCNRRLPPKKPRLLKVQPQISRRIGMAASDLMFPKCNRRLPPKKPRLLKVQPQISRRIGMAASDQMFPKCNRCLPPKKPRLLNVQPQISRRIGKAASDQMFPKCNRCLPPKKPRLLNVQPQISRRIGKAASDQKLWLHIDATAKENSAKINRVEDKVDSAAIDIEGTRRRIVDLERDNSRMKDDMNYILRSQSMRNNIILGNVPEQPGETPAKTEQVKPEVTERMEEPNVDEGDGIGRLLRHGGRYNPRKCEEEDKTSRGTDQLSDYEDPDEHIFQLLKATAPDGKWREGLGYLMRREEKEDFLRKTLAFLHNTVAAGINKIDEGSGYTSLDIDTSSAPDGINCADWMKVMEGLGFELTSPGNVKNIDYVDVVISEKTDAEVLKGFCCLLHSMTEISWTNFQMLLKLRQEDGQLLWETVTLLRNGVGIQPESRTRLDELEERFPYLMKSLGFKKDNKSGTGLQWERSDGQSDRLYWALHGLFRPTGLLETPV